MSDDITTKVINNPKYKHLTETRSRYGWTLTVIMLLVYYGYVVLIAFDKEFLAKPIGAGVMTVGIPIGFGIILFTIIITGIYVRRANTEFDALTQEIIKESRQ